MLIDSKILDDMARLAAGAVGTVVGMRDELEGQFRQQLERVLGRLDLVTREEFETVQEMAAQAREENEALAQRLEALEAKLAQGSTKRSGGSRAKSDEANDHA